MVLPLLPPPSPFSKFTLKEVGFCFVFYAHLSFISRNELCLSGIGGKKRANLVRRRREEKFLAAAAKKQKLLPKIAESTEGEGQPSHKRGPKVCASFSECSCVKVGGERLRASKSGGFVYLSPVNSMRQRKSQTRFPKRKKKIRPCTTHSNARANIWVLLFQCPIFRGKMWDNSQVL